jgi:glycosyltransferase involved in cell wall biosynthesis
MIELAAIVSVYHSHKWLRRRLNNLVATTTYKRGALQIFCVDAAHDPADEAILNDFSAHTNIVVHRIPDCTVYAAWNYAIQHSVSKYICNANSDDLVHPDAYEKLIASCRDHSLAYCDWYVVADDNGGWNQIMDTNPQAGNVSWYNPPGNASCGHFPLWKRDLHDKIGLFDPKMRALGDADFWWRLRINKLDDFLLVAEPLGAYAWRFGDNLWTKTPEEDRAREWQTLYGRQPGRIDF